MKGKVTLTFEDIEGKIFFRADYAGGFTDDSPAHLLANQVIKWLDEQASDKTILDAVADLDPVDAPSNGHGTIWIPGEH